jgi:hypothetical protein
MRKTKAFIENTQRNSELSTHITAIINTNRKLRKHTYFPGYNSLMIINIVQNDYFSYSGHPVRLIDIHTHKQYSSEFLHPFQFVISPAPTHTHTL